MGDQSEERRHEGRSDVRARHLHADDRLRMLLPEVGGRCVNDRGIDGRAAQPHDDEPDQRANLRVYGDRDEHDADDDDACADADELSVAQLFGDESA